MSAIEKRAAPRAYLSAGSRAVVLASDGRIGVRSRMRPTPVCLGSVRARAAFETPEARLFDRDLTGVMIQAYRDTRDCKLGIHFLRRVVECVWVSIFPRRWGARAYLGSLEREAGE